MYKLRAKATSTTPVRIQRPGSVGTGSPAGPGETAGAGFVLRSAIAGSRAGASWPKRGRSCVGTNAPSAPEDYHAHRIALGVPEGGKDYVLGDTFPHEADMDQLNGVSFSKGCFVGQEVVSRMQNRAHRAQARGAG